MTDNQYNSAMSEYQNYDYPCNGFPEGYNYSCKCVSNPSESQSSEVEKVNQLQLNCVEDTQPNFVEIYQEIFLPPSGLSDSDVMLGEAIDELSDYEYDSDFCYYSDYDI